MAAPRRNPKLSHPGPSGRSRTVSATAAEVLRGLLQRNGCIRVPHDERRRALGRRYKKGWEVRLVLKSPDELEEVRRLLVSVNLKPGGPFTKARQLVQPVYGKKAVDFFTGRVAT